MASTYSSDLKLELMTTGEKSGTWGTITNTNFQQLEQAASGYIAVDEASSDVALSLANGAVSNGKNLYFKLTGTLTGNRNVTMPDSAERVFIIQDATSRSASLYSLTVKTRPTPPQIYKPCSGRGCPPKCLRILDHSRRSLAARVRRR